MIKEVNSLLDLPSPDDPDLEVGDVYRVRSLTGPGGGVVLNAFGDVLDVGPLVGAGTVLKFDGRGWVRLRDVETAATKTDGKKNDATGDGGASNDDDPADGGNVAPVRPGDDPLSPVMSLAEKFETEFRRQWPYANMWETEWRNFAIIAIQELHGYDCACVVCETRVSAPVELMHEGETRTSMHGVGCECRVCSKARMDAYVMSKEDIKQTSHRPGLMQEREYMMRDGGKKRHDIQAQDSDADVVARWMPRDFVTWYVAVVSLITGPSGVGYDDNALPGVGKSYGGLGQVKSGSSQSLKLNSQKNSSESTVLMRSEYASVIKEGVDRKLRKIGRDLKLRLDEEEKRRTGRPGTSARRRCSGKCGKFGESDWLYCARCGDRMEEVD